MRKIFIFLLALFASIIGANAQQFKGGIAAGLIGSQVAGDTYSGFNKPGAYASFWVSLDLNERSSLKTELSYFQKGSRHNPDEKHNDYTFYLMRLGYIEMPFLYQLHLKNKFTIEVGPSFSYLLHSYEALDYTENEVSYGAFDLFNPSVVLGFGYPVTEKISLNFRMDSSILSMRDNNIPGEVYRLFDSGQYNDCILFFLGYKL